MKDNKDYLIGGALVVAGGIAAATGFGGPLGMMLIGAGADMIIQRATTGSVNYIEVAVSGLLGAAGGAGGSALAGRLGLKGVWAAAASGAGAGALPGGTMGGYSYMSSPGPHTPAGFLQATATGTLEGGVTGGLGGAAGHGLTTLGRTALGRLRPTTPRLSQDCVNVVDAARTQHILYGDHGSPTNIQGHLWPGDPKKTPFPRDWSRDQIMHNISDIATNPATSWEQQTGPTGSLYTNAGKPSRFKADEWRNGIQIRVIYQPANAEVITGFRLKKPWYDRVWPWTKGEI